VSSVRGSGARSREKEESEARLVGVKAKRPSINWIRPTRKRKRLAKFGEKVSSRRLLNTLRKGTLGGENWADDGEKSVGKVYPGILKELHARREKGGASINGQPPGGWIPRQASKDKNLPKDKSVKANVIRRTTG